MSVIKRIAPIILGVLLLTLLAACAPAANPAPSAVAPTPTVLSMPPTAITVPTALPTSGSATTNSNELSGASLYQISCAACHGQDRAGITFDLDGQKISAPSLAWADLSSTYSADPSRGTINEQVAISITKGLDETGGDLNAMMPRWSDLSQSQVDSLVQFLQTETTSTGPVPTLTDAGLNLTGEGLYQASCSACHGADGAGKVFEKEDNKISTPSLSWAELTTTYSADPSRGTIAEQIALSITKGLDEEGSDLNAMMPRWSFLNQAQIDSLVQYIQSAFK